MNPADDKQLYMEDRPAWIEAASTRVASRIDAGVYDDQILVIIWAGMERDYQAATWAKLSDVARAMIKRLRSSTP